MPTGDVDTFSDELAERHSVSRLIAAQVVTAVQLRESLGDLRIALEPA